MEDDTYSEVKKITDGYYAGERNTFAYDIFQILLKNNIQPRRDDGKLHSLQISYPTSRPGLIVVGLRYFKKNGKNTEDCFLLEPGKPIQKLYKGRIERLFPEYKGTHHAQIKSADETVPEGFDKV